MNPTVAFWSILMKDVRNYYLKPPNISWGIIFPLSWTIMQFSMASGTVSIKELLPGMIGMSILFGTTSMLAVTITFEKRSRSFDRLLLAPVGMGTVVVSKISGAVLFGMLNSIWPILFSLALSADLSDVNWGLILIGVLLIAVVSALLGLVIATSAKEVFEAQTMSNFFRFPMLFLCGLFIPIASLPLVLQPVSYCLPLTYGIDIMHDAVLGSGIMGMGVDIVASLIFVALLFALCVHNIKVKWIR